MKQLPAYILLGIIQGATEFLPVSSSGHLVIAQRFLELEKTGIILDVSLHFGTLLAIFVVFREDLWTVLKDSVYGCILFLRERSVPAVRAKAPLFSVGIAIVVGTIPVAIAGGFFENFIRGFFQSELSVTGGFIILTGLILLSSRYAPNGDRTRVHPLRGFLVGIAQVLALFPGVSRSGTTIVAGYFVGLDRNTAARFSFLLAVPAILGAMVLETQNLLTTQSLEAISSSHIIGLVAGTLTSALVGWICLVALLKIIRRGQLYWFAVYCLPLGLVLVLFGLG